MQICRRPCGLLTAGCAALPACISPAAGSNSLRLLRRYNQSITPNQNLVNFTQLWSAWPRRAGSPAGLIGACCPKLRDRTTKNATPLRYEVYYERRCGRATKSDTPLRYEAYYERRCGHVTENATPLRYEVYYERRCSRATESATPLRYEVYYEHRLPPTHSPTEAT